MTKHIIKLPSGLFPFRLNELSSCVFDNYRLVNVFGEITPTQRKACVELWMRCGVIPTEQAALERSLQVCYMLYTQVENKLVGVNTLYKDRLAANQEQFLMNRMFIDPQYRNSRLMITGTALMLVYARTKLANLGIRGVVNVNENGKLSRPGMQRIFHRLGYRSQGFLDGKEVLFFEFDRITIQES